MLGQNTRRIIVPYGYESVITPPSLEPRQQMQTPKNVNLKLVHTIHLIRGQNPKITQMHHLPIKTQIWASYKLCREKHVQFYSSRNVNIYNPIVSCINHIECVYFSIARVNYISFIVQFLQSCRLSYRVNPFIHFYNQVFISKYNILKSSVPYTSIYQASNVQVNPAFYHAYF